MDKQVKKIILRQKRHARVRARVSGTNQIPRVAVFKSANHIYGQTINDVSGKTLLSQSDFKISKKEVDSVKTVLKGKVKNSFVAGSLLALKMKDKKITRAVFDRGGFKYHGRIKAFAEGLRKGGIKL